MQTKVKARSIFPSSFEKKCNVHRQYLTFKNSKMLVEMQFKECLSQIYFFPFVRMKTAGKSHSEGTYRQLFEKIDAKKQVIVSWFARMDRREK